MSKKVFYTFDEYRKHFYPEQYREEKELERQLKFHLKSCEDCRAFPFRSCGFGQWIRWQIKNVYCPRSSRALFEAVG